MKRRLKGPAAKTTQLMVFATIVGLAASLGGCQTKPSGGNAAAGDVEPSTAAAAGISATPAIPADIQAVADAALGAGAVVVASGDLGAPGTLQVLAVNPLKPGEHADAAGDGVLVSRAVIVEKETAGWKEILRCDEGLKNPEGYLAGSPEAAASGWRLRIENPNMPGMTIFLTPLDAAGAAAANAIAVRWNPAVKRYQSLDRNLKAFRREAGRGETPAVSIRP